ncbi:hypothetical protein CALCODRAFT_235754 [Calocera cornea HHB12733]|uniref:Uncharacterized protein n=1 Tax=Calocera cornea HHB12733 TaxID=1353952 RepID=A0A165GUV7_9BASI|nr:hypothetical protein CALCODRAFT_235754 [Calocera cornea HHB12733]
MDSKGEEGTAATHQALQRRCHWVPPHCLLHHRLTVRETFAICQRREPVSSDDAVELCLCFSLH